MLFVAPAALPAPAGAKLAGGWNEPVVPMPATSAGFLANNCCYPGYGSYVPGLYHTGIDLPRPANSPV